MDTTHQRALRGITIAALLLALCFNGQQARAGGVVSGCSEASLRAALLGGGEVTFTTDCSISLSEQIVINQAATTIDANGHAVVITGASNGVPLFDVSSDLTLRGLRFANGRSTATGGALYVRPNALVIASHCVFVGNSVVATNGLAGSIGGTNSAGTGGAGSPGGQGVSAFGGAIYNAGKLALINCTLTNNSVTAGAGGSGGNGGNGDGTFAVGGNGGDGGAGGLASGGAIYNVGNLTLRDCIFFGNKATGGTGGAGASGGSGSFTGLPGNGGMGGLGYGGAVYNALNLSLASSTFATNSALGGATATAGTSGNGKGIKGLAGADGAGGGIYNAWWAVVTNCTFYTNTAFGGAGGNGGNGGGTFLVPGDGGDGGNGIGGAIANANTLTLANCTLSSSGAYGGTNGAAGTGNFTADAGRFGLAQGGNLANVGPVLTLVNSILAGSPSGGNLFGTLSDGDYNLSSDAISAFGDHSIQNTNPKLGALSANGGPTLTMALLSGSPAIDQVPAELSAPTDQRGFARPFRDLADIGAFEFGAASGAVTNAVTLSVSRAANGTVRLSSPGTPGVTYLIQVSTNLSTWQTIATNAASIQFTDPVTNFSARFYRIRH